MAFAKCPKCEKGMLSLRAESIDLKHMSGGSYQGVVYSCPSCSSAISAEVDFLALKSDIINGVVAKLKR